MPVSVRKLRPNTVHCVRSTSRHLLQPVCRGNLGISNAEVESAAPASLPKNQPLIDSTVRKELLVAGGVREPSQNVEAFKMPVF